MANSEQSERKLTPKQEAFCQEYLKDLNATQAAIRAGYSEDTARQMGSENLSKPVIQAAIQEAMQARSARTAITADYVLTTIRDTVERCRQAEPVMEFDHVDKCMKPTGEWQFEHGGVLKGCELLGKHLKLFADRVEHSGPDGKPIEHRDLSKTPEAVLDQKLEALLSKRKEPPPVQIEPPDDDGEEHA